MEGRCGRQQPALPTFQVAAPGLTMHPDQPISAPPSGKTLVYIHGWVRLKHVMGMQAARGLCHR